MIQRSRLRALIQEQAERQAVHQALLDSLILPLAEKQESEFNVMADRRERQRSIWEELDELSGKTRWTRGESSTASQRRTSELLLGRTDPSPFSHPKESNIAMGVSLQPVRDITSGAVTITAEDRALPVYGPPYTSEWTSVKDKVPPLSNYPDPPLEHKSWAMRDFGTIGFQQHADVGGQAMGGTPSSAAAVYVGFVPRITPGVAQIRPYCPYIFQYLSFNLGANLDNYAGFGIRVWSWNLDGNDQSDEQNYRYLVWSRDSSNNNPSWYEQLQPDDTHLKPRPGWDDDHAFLWGKEAPYFSVRTGRVYVAAVWCFGGCKAAGKSGLTIGRIHAEIPMIVIGSQ